MVLLKNCCGKPYYEKLRQKTTVTIIVLIAYTQIRAADKLESHIDVCKDQELCHIKMPE